MMARFVQTPSERAAGKRAARQGDWRGELERWRKLAREMAEVLERWREACGLFGESDPARRLDGLARLRALENPMLQAIEQCHDEAQVIERRWRIYAEPSAWAVLHEQHEQGTRLARNILDELRFATLDRIADAAVAAEGLAKVLSDHLVFEQGLLGQIETNRAAEEKLLVRYTESGD